MNCPECGSIECPGSVGLECAALSPVANSKLLPGFKSIHLTLCGSQAGRCLCDFARTDDDERNGVKFLHAVYAPKAIFADSRLCAECLNVWNESEVAE